MSRREDYHLPIIQKHIALRLGRPLKRVPENSRSGPTPDLATNDGRSPRVAIEVKELVPSDFLATRHEVSRDQGYNSSILAWRWSVVVTESGLDARLAPMPVLPDDPVGPAIEEMSRLGLTLVTKAQRERDWTEQHTLSPRKRVAIKGLAKEIEPHLAVLEHYGILETRSHSLPTDSQKAYQVASEAVWAIKQRTDDSICMAHTPFVDQVPGVDLVFGYGQVRKGRADVVVQRVQMWLDSDFSSNMVTSLANSGADERHGALWLSTEPEAQSATERGVGFLPTLPLALPEGVDVIWIFVGPMAWKYDARRMPPPPIASEK